MIARITALVIKELQELMSSRRGVAVLFMPLILQTLIIPYVITMDVTRCEIALLNEDAGPHGAELVQRLAAAPYMTRVESVAGERELLAALDTNRVLAAVHIPADFSRRIARGESAPLQVITDGRRSNSAQIAAGYVGSIATQLGLELTGKDATGGLTVRHLYNPNLNYRWFLLPCFVGLLGMITCFNVCAMAIAREREEGTYEQLCITPMGRFELLAGKTLPALVIVLLQVGVIVLLACWVHGLPLTGSLPALFGAASLFCLALGGIGFSLSAFCNTQQQAFVGMFCVMIPFILVSGFFSPVENMPTALQYVSRIDPLYYLFSVSHGVFLKGYTLGDIIPQLSALSLIAGGSLLFAYIVLRLRSS